MATPKIMSGGRAKVAISTKGTSETRIVGIFTDISYGVTYSAQPAFILGSHIAQAIEYTSVEAVNISASGWRAIGHGIHKDGALPRVQDLLTAEYIEFTIFDRASNDLPIAKIRNVRPVGASMGYSTGQLSSVSFSYIGILVDDEDVTNAEAPSAAVLA